MRIVVHAGMQKTGSSALQEYLVDQRDALAAQGVIYPDLGHRSHWPLARALAKEEDSSHKTRSRGKNSNEEVDPAAIRAAMTAVFGDARPGETLVISHENFSLGHSCRRLTAFLNQLVPEAEIVFVAYIRNPVDHFASAVQQSLKTDFKRPFQPLTWVSPHIGRATSLLDCNVRCHFRLYSRAALAGGDISTDFMAFLAQLGVTRVATVKDTPTTNSSLTAPACALLSFVRDEDRSELRKAVRRTVRTFDSEQGGTKLVLPAEWRPMLERVNAKPWNELMTRLVALDLIHDPVMLSNEVQANSQEVDVAGWLRAGLERDYCERMIAWLNKSAASSSRMKEVARFVEGIAERATS